MLRQFANAFFVFNVKFAMTAWAVAARVSRWLPFTNDTSVNQTPTPNPTHPHLALNSARAFYATKKNFALFGLGGANNIVANFAFNRQQS